MKIRIAQIRGVPEKGDLQGNHDRLMSVLGDVAKADVDVVVTPECFLDGYVATEDSVSRDSIKDYAINPSDSRYLDSVSDWARENRAWVVLGCCRLAPEGIYNTAIVIGRGGNPEGFYDKTHCQTHDKKFTPGQRITAFESDFGLFGVMICADRRWPETTRSLAIQGARVIFNPTYGMHDEMNLRMMQTRSYESEVFIAFTHPMQSLITGPTGEIICNETHEDGYYSVVELDLTQVDEIRVKDFAHLKDRRPELYES